MKFREMLARNQAYLAPAVFNPLSAKLAEQAGFQMLYLSGGALGYIKCSLEANLSLTDVIQTGVEIRAACELPLIMDGVCGWGDPMHVGFTVKMAEADGVLRHRDRGPASAQARASPCRHRAYDSAGADGRPKCAKRCARGKIRSS